MKAGRASLSPMGPGEGEPVPKDLSHEVREDVRRMREALRDAARQSPLSYSQVEEALGMCGGYLSVIFGGKVELRVAHVFGILRAIGAEPRQFFLELRAVEGQGESTPPRAPEPSPPG